MVLVRPPQRARGVDDEQQHARGQHEGADSRQQVERVPAQVARVAVDTPRHAQQARDVHREEGQVEAAEHQSEDPAAPALRQAMAVEYRRPEVEAREQREHHAADQHVVQMGDDEVAVVRLPVEGQHRHHDAGQAAQHEDEMKAQQEQRGRVRPHLAAPESRNPGEHLHAARERDQEARGRSHCHREVTHARGEHVVDPEREAHEPDAGERGHDRAIGHQPGARERRDHHRNHARGRQEDDVDLRMPEEPEQVLPQQRVAAAPCDEEGPVEGALYLQQRGRCDHRRKGEDDHQRRHQHGPGEDWHAHQRHAGRAREQDADDELDGARDSRDLDEADAQQPPVRAASGRELLAGERRVHEPAAIGRLAEEEGAEEDQSADRIGPEGIGRQPRKGQVARAQHAGQQVDRHRLDDRYSEKEHHHRAVHGEELVVGSHLDQRVVGDGQLRAHYQRERTGQYEKEHRGRDVVHADARVVDGRERPPARWRLPRALECLAFARGPGQGGRQLAHFSWASQAAMACRLLSSMRSCDEGMRAPGFSCCVCASQRARPSLSFGRRPAPK
ncbi:hypothetical protein APY03_5763 [Variovorax sp. WDL1]|nr:hypothetical protein APY03_5763 [Variovorax sp. WDL1]